MVESGTVFTIIKGVRENWDLLLKILHIPRKKVAEPTYDEASFSRCWKAEKRNRCGTLIAGGTLASFERTLMGLSLSDG